MGSFRLDVRSATKTAGTVMFVGLICLFVVFAVPQVIGVSHSFVVLSSSMSPTLHAGDAVLVDDTEPQQVGSGDVITYTPPAGAQGYGTDRVTHRVVEVVQKDDGLYFRTKGDANEDPDPSLVPAENLVGTVVFTAPYFGHLILFADSDVGILVLVITPAVLLGLNELVALISSATPEATEGEEPPSDAGVNDR